MIAFGCASQIGIANYVSALSGKIMLYDNIKRYINKFSSL